MFSTVLIANRGEIALRIARTCAELGIRTIVAHSTADAGGAAARFADETIQVGPASARHSYLNAAALISAALQTGAEAIHPGYGFLSEDADFADACRAHGIMFIGPSATVLDRFGDKMAARQFAESVGLPVLPGSPRPASSAGEAKQVAGEVGYPVIIKASNGGGGRGMTVVRTPADFAASYSQTQTAAQLLFGSRRVYVEKYLDLARHVEVQILGDSHGNAVHLGTRDCSVQRFRQKLLEETPAPGVAGDTAARMGEAAARAAQQIGYCGAGTLEFLVDPDDRFYFIEANCRIQVEHPVTEATTGLDLVREQILAATGAELPIRQQDVTPRGAAIECRVNAEDPGRDFLPTPGVVDVFVPPSGPFTRVDTHGYPGMEVTPYYDSLLAKVIVWAPDREQSVARMDRALGEFAFGSKQVRTTIGFLREVLAHPLFQDGKHSTSLVDMMMAREP
jgi:acetyl-CoA carboxylase, biotin carboxylase subunit